MLNPYVFLATFFACHWTFSCAASTLPSEIDIHFSEGTKHYEAKNYEGARRHFLQVAQLTPNSDVFLNLGLTEYQLGNYGLALAYWRKALDLSPLNFAAQDAIEFLLAQNKLSSLKEDSTFITRIHKAFLRFVPLPVLLLLNLGFLIYGFWALLSYWGQKRKMRQANELPPTLPSKIPITLVLWAILSGLTVAKYYDQRLVRVTIITKKTPLKAGPAEESANLTELFEGQELLVQRLEKDWYQVQYAGRMTGWISRASVQISSAGSL